MEDQDDEDSESFPLPEITRVYKVKYQIKGRQGKLLLEMCSCIIGLDVCEIIDTLRSKLLGIEINGKDADGEMYFETVDSIDMHYCELIAPVHGMTDKAFDVIKIAYESASLFPLVSDEVDDDQEDQEEEGK